ncbi:hypothetical protein GTA08_BOTSDO01707 [Neofusicoccum parvum]|uniref:Uncharacterized protein n=1 Tax=Neofusicoccum parvum TaxID=310453 RepID=A0ACB5SMK9_9PEZI|nr:hypothetical protein GTA08_BOTSDO01707 [Neofusicoccum parvum]
MTKSRTETIGSMEMTESPVDMRRNTLRGEATATRLEATNKLGRLQTALDGNFKSLTELEKLQVAFNENFKSHTEPVKHDVTSVLMLSWEKEGSDMDVSDEIATLARVFNEDYHFIVEQKQLKEDKNTQLQLNVALSTFMMDYNDPHNLCIIYYAGHGFTKDSLGELYLTNSSTLDSRKPSRRMRNEIAWHRAEDNIRNTLADVLVIFDCCYAGALQDFRSSGHSFEFLGACGRDQLTPGPGKQSFTSALIWALRDSELRGKDGFDSAELRKTLMSAPDFRSGEHYRSQTPMLFHRQRPNEDHVWVAPTKQPGEDVPVSPNKPLPHYRENGPMEYLDLRFRFSKEQTEAQVEELAKALSQFVRQYRSDMGVRSVDLRDHVTVSNMMVVLWRALMPGLVSSTQIWSIPFPIQITDH